MCGSYLDVCINKKIGDDIMDEVECTDCLARTINFTTGDVLLKWMKINNEKLENYVLRYFLYKKFIGSAIRVTEFFLIDLSVLD